MQYSRSIEALTQAYNTKAFYAQMEAERAVLSASFAEVEREKARLGEEAFTTLSCLYTDTQAALGSSALPPDTARELRYRLYDAYFSQLAALRWRVRSKIHAEKHIRHMKNVLKGRGEFFGAARFWMRFSIQCLPGYAAGLVGLLWCMEAIDSQLPLWHLILSLILVAGGFGIYFWRAYELEGQRLYADLERWLSYRINPDGRDRPSDLLQYAKMAVPLVVAVGSAMIKLYLQ